MPRRSSALLLAAAWLAACTSSAGREKMEKRSGDALVIEAVASQPDAVGQVQVRVVISNPAGRPSSVQVSRYCPVRLQVRAGTGEIVWDETKERACPFVARLIELPAGASETILHTLDAGELLSRGVLCSGRYSVSALVAWDLTVKILNAGEFDVHAGC